MKESAQQQATVQIRNDIEQEKKKRGQIIDQLRRLRSKLNYKEAEYAALSKLTAAAHAPKNVGKLKRLKSSIEFKISTEATTLGAEKELIKKLNDINQELEDALKVYKFRRKLDLVSKNVADIGKALESYRLQIAEVDKKLDVLYASLREHSGWARKEERRPPRRQKQEEHFEVSLEDIATIKNKKNEDNGD